jgi:GDP-4-dehydro-6-deoxy-D-mannose reductase
MTTLLVGANGFIAPYIRARLALLHQEVVLVDRAGGQASGVVQCDLSSLHEAREIIHRFAPDRILNLAGSFTHDYEMDFAANYSTSKNILDAIRELNLQTRVLLTGSAAEYGPIDQEDNPVKEDHPLRPSSVYGLTKAMQTMLMHCYVNSWGMNIVMARPFNLLGQGMSARLFVGSVYAQIGDLRAGKISAISVGNLETRRDYLRVEKAADDFVTIMDRGEPGEVYNVGSGSSVRIRDVLESILRESGLTMDVVKESSGNRRTAHDPLDVYADIRKLRLLG